MDIGFYTIGEIRDEDCVFVVMVSRHNNKWLIIKHKERRTWEIPGGHRESLETLDQAARRELFEETGAEELELFPISIYSVYNGRDISFGMLFYAEVAKIGKLPDSEIGEIKLMDNLPQANLTYPQIYPSLFKKVIEYLQE